MSNYKDSNPAFPTKGCDYDGDEVTYHGINMRDWFATFALHAHLVLSRWNPELAASEAYKYADAMLAEREK